ncbi:hypothetical protein RMATCC62417_15060 [Rhizopus microsporus]|nr:hypothetical protein RMATCC62417_15060 [Rhizopus microsporus]
MKISFFSFLSQSNMNDTFLQHQLSQENALTDALFALYHSSKHHATENIQRFIDLYEPICHSLHNNRLSIKDFDFIHKDVFAKGAFGKVTIVRHKDQIYAMKILNKSYLISQMDRSSPMDERLVLAKNDEWIPKLYASFQDGQYLYLVMEYAPGGDLQGLMERRNFKFTEEEAKFYIAELVLAVERIHQWGYMHRDIKPGNILIDRHGHIKLGDLGSCIPINTKYPLLMVGTMSYVSPEMCSSEGFDSSLGPAYGPESDWWSVGVVLYELLYGVPPFTGKDIQIQIKLMDPKVNVQFDDSIQASSEAKDLLSKLLHKSDKCRLGHNGAEEIKSHPFFKDVQWQSIRTSTTPPFVPPISALDDVTFFSVTNDDDDDDDKEDEDEEGDNLKDKDFPFIGYTYVDKLLEGPSREVQDEQKAEQQQNGDQPEDCTRQMNDLKQQVSILQDENEKLSTKCEASVCKMNALNEHIAHLEQKLTAHQEESLKDTKRHLERIKALEDELSAREKESQQMMTKYKQKLEREYQQNSQAITQKLDNHMQYLRMMESENLKLKSENDAQKTRIAALEKELMAATTHSEKAHVQLEERYDAKLKTQEQEYQTNVQQLHLELNSLQQKLQEMQQENQNRSCQDELSSNKSKILSVMWQRDRDHLHSVQQTLADTESSLAAVRREVARLKKEIKYYQMNSLRKEKKLYFPMEINDDVSMIPNLIDSIKAPMTRRRKRINLSASLSNLSSLATRDISSDHKMNSIKSSINDKQMKEIESQIKIEKEFIASTQRALTARARLSRVKTEFDQELHESIAKSNAKILNLQEKLKQVH